MDSRIITTCYAIGIAAAFTIGIPAVGVAQVTSDTTAGARGATTTPDTTTRSGATSTQRIRIHKETGATTGLDTSSAAGAVATPRRDTTTAVPPTTGVTTGRDTTGMRSDTTGLRTDTTGIRSDTTRTDTTMMPTPLPTGRDTTGIRSDTSTLLRDTTGVSRDTSAIRSDTSGAARDTSASASVSTGIDTATSTGAIADTLPRTRTDTVTTTTTVHTDTLATMPGEMRRGRFGKGFYIGVGGGASVPTGNFDNGFKTGWNVTVPIGWQSSDSPWGVRLDASYDRVTGRSFGTGPASFALRDAGIWSGQLDLTLLFPFGSNGTGLYLMGGGGVHHFSYGSGFNSSTPVPYTGATSGSETKLGVNGGAGLNFSLGSASMFLESRYVSVFTKGKNTNYVPIVLGFRFF